MLLRHETTVPAATDTTSRLDVVIAIPVCNERDHIAGCLHALLNQRGACPTSYGILLFLNNCTDGTGDVVDAIMRKTDTPIRVFVETFAGASAGWARRRAMDEAAVWLQADGSADSVLLTSDADSLVPSDWLMRNLAAIAAGAHAVSGRICLDPDDAMRLPESLHARGALEEQYESLLTEIGARLDPDPNNPWPTHWSQSGATIAIRLSTYRLIGGVPDLALGEDRAMIEAVKARDLPVRHDPAIVVTTSGRLEGRATGGCADTMKLRCEQPDAPCDDRLERCARAVMRVLLRRHLRSRFRRRRLATRFLGVFLNVPIELLGDLQSLPHFGQAYARIEAASPRLRFRPVRPRELPMQIRLARLLAVLLRFTAASIRGPRRGDTSTPALVASLLPREPTLP